MYYGNLCNCSKVKQSCVSFSLDLEFSVVPTDDPAVSLGSHTYTDSWVGAHTCGIVQRAVTQSDTVNGWKHSQLHIGSTWSTSNGYWKLFGHLQIHGLEANLGIGIYPQRGPRVILGARTEIYHADHWQGRLMKIARHLQAWKAIRNGNGQQDSGHATRFINMFVTHEDWIIIFQASTIHTAQGI